MGDFFEALAKDVYDRVLAEYRARTTQLEPYPRDLNADWGETPEGLRHAFEAGARPPWPGPRAAPELMARWRELRRTRATGAMQPGIVTAHRFLWAGSRNSNSSALAGRSAWQNSRNWSGAVLTARDGERFSAVTGRWRVPDVLSAEGPPALPGLKGAPPSRRCSVWIGLDGHSGLSNSLPQIGTTTAEVFAAEGRTVECYAWAQWWVRNEKHGEVIFADFPVSPDDEVVCWLALQDHDRVVMCIRNETQGCEDSVIWRSGPQARGRGTQVHEREAPVPGYAAVWVVERPTLMDAEDLYPLPAFGEVAFTDCIAGVRAPRQPFHEIADLRDLSACRLVRMFDRRTAPWRATRISIPSRDPADRTRLLVRRREEGEAVTPSA